jgi:hypothetical protein
MGQTSEGCPYDCTFCTVWKTHGRKVTLASLANVQHDFLSLPASIRGFFFADDIWMQASEQQIRELYDPLLEWMASDYPPAPSRLVADGGDPDRPLPPRGGSLQGLDPAGRAEENPFRRGGCDRRPAQELQQAQHGRQEQRGHPARRGDRRPRNGPVRHPLRRESCLLRRDCPVPEDPPALDQDFQLHHRDPAAGYRSSTRNP